MYIYKITNLINGKIYIGQTVAELSKRLYSHRYNSRIESNNSYLYRSMRKYGELNFEIEPIFCVLDRKYLSEFEIYFISIIRPELNMTEGGYGGDTSNSPNFKRSMEIYHANKTYDSYATYGMKGKTHSDESKIKQSESRKKYWERAGNKERLSNRIKGKNNPMYGKTPKNALKICYNNIVYPSISAACRDTGLSIYKLKKNGEIIYD